LGIALSDTSVERYSFDPGDVIVLFSDGLVERDPTFDEDALDAQLARWSSLGAVELAHALRQLATTLSPVHDDDVAVLVIRRDDAI
jgi:serine phosphatase RsbU (regulator of sigma subunit)